MDVLQRRAFHAGVIGGRLTLTFIVVSVQALAFPRLNLRQFGVRIKFFPGELLGTLQRSNAVVGPHSLKIGLAVGRTRRSPRRFGRSRGLRFLRWSRLAAGGYSREQQRDHGCENEISHRTPAWWDTSEGTVDFRGSQEL